MHNSLLGHVSLEKNMTIINEEDKLQQLYSKVQLLPSQTAKKIFGEAHIIYLI